MKLYHLLFLFFPFQLFCMHPDEAIKLNPALEGQINEVKKKKDATNPDPEILALAQNVLKQSNIPDPIIIVQRNNRTNSYSIFASNPVQRYMAISVANRTLHAIESDMYHECGHLFHNHVCEKVDQQQRNFNKKTKLCSIANGILGFAAVAKLNRGIIKWPLGIISGLLTGYSTLVSSALYRGKKHVGIEKQADEFMYKKLIEQNKVSQAIEEISDYLYEHEFSNERPLPKWISGYPHNIERAKIGVDQLKNHGISLESVIANPPADLDPGVKDHFAEQIKKWFPEELEK